MAKRPTKAQLYAFNMGFGDCFLLRFVYENENRHVLIDFGTMRRPDGASKTLENDVADEIASLTGGKLEILIATHRHQDHISGFTTKESGKGSGDKIRDLNPQLVMQPWTEDPQVAKSATGPRAFQASLANMSSVAEGAHAFATGKGYRLNEKWRGLSTIGMDNISNKSAVENLIDMGKRGAYEPLFLKAEDEIDISELLPGVSVTVMGPPSVDQWPEVRKQAENYRGQYWLKRAGMSNGADQPGVSDPLFPKHVVEDIPTYAGWVASRARDAQAESLYGIVRALDNAMNNTSLILLFEAGGKKMLFPGDAQGENWAYALTQPKWVEKLKDVDLYKVGHHGSRNATPMPLWDTFNNRGPKTKKGRMKSVMSTKHGVHGESDETAVPRSKLVDALKRETDHQTTEGSRELYILTEITL
jgi:hypothetical protein